MTGPDPDKPVQITVYTTYAKREEMKAYAKARGLSLSEWLALSAAGEMVRADDEEIQARRDKLEGVTRDLRAIARELRNDVQQKRAQALIEGVFGEEAVLDADRGGTAPAGRHAGR